MLKLDHFLRFAPIPLLALACSEDGNELAKTPNMPSGGEMGTAGSDGEGGMGQGGAMDEQGGMGAGGAGAEGGTAGDGGASGGEGGMECPGATPDRCGEECVKLSNDPAFCGDCMTACDPGAACAEGTCSAAPTELATIEACGALTMTLQGDTLYLANNTGDAAGTILSVPVAGGAPTVIARDQNQPTGIAADAMGVYWTTQGEAGGSIMKAPLPSGEPVALVEGLDPPSRDVAVANDLVFYSTGDESCFLADETPEGDPPACLLYKIATSGDDAEGTYVTCTPLKGIASALFADADRLYWTSASREAVETDEQTDGVPAAACAEAGDEGYVELGESQGSLYHETIFAADGYAYWATGSKVVRAEVAEPASETVGFEMDVEPVTGFAVVDTMLYMAGEGGTVQRVDFSAELATDPIPMAIGQDMAGSLVVDATNLYWVTADCKVMAAAL